MPHVIQRRDHPSTRVRFRSERCPLSIGTLSAFNRNAVRFQSEWVSAFDRNTQMSGDPGIGLKLGSEPRFERYQPSAMAAVCSRSFRDALQRIARYKQLTCPEENARRCRTSPKSSD